MSNQYAPQTPVGKSGGEKQGYPPAKIALASANQESALVSSILLLGHDTTEIEVAAVTGTVSGKWLTQATVDSSVAGTSVITAFALGANFDFTVNAGTQRRFVVPVATFVGSSTSVQGANRANGLYPAVAFKGTIGSVLVAQY